MTALVIFGAGASYDSVDSDTLSRPLEFRPPLARELFDNRERFGEIAEQFPLQGLNVQLRKSVSRGEPIERTLDNLQERAQHDDRAAQQLMALRFYLRQIIDDCGRTWLERSHGLTNYHALAERLDRWSRATGNGVTYVTFNYDTMVEHALERESPFDGQRVRSYIEHERVKLIRPHGSVGWGYTIHLPESSFPRGRNPIVVIEHAARLPKLSELKIHKEGPGYPQTWARGINDEYWVPALAVPVERKTKFVCPESHIQQLVSILPTVDRVLIIGWRATEENFTDLFKNNAPTAPALFLACAGEEDKTIERLMSARDFRAGGDGQYHRSGDKEERTFSNLIGSADLEAFLSF